jgi:hypothetical protein
MVEGGVGRVVISSIGGTARNAARSTLGISGHPQLAAWGSDLGRPTKGGDPRSSLPGIPTWKGALLVPAGPPKQVPPRTFSSGQFDCAFG